ncbi:JmjC domain-containing histone demethylation protein 1 [Cryptotrichosporon argae]
MSRFYPEAPTLPDSASFPSLAARAQPPTPSTKPATRPSPPAAATEQNEEPCVLCQATGPPPTVAAQLIWIGCTKCSDWFHSACVLREETQRATLPAEVIEAWREGGEEVWFNWPGLIDKWFCQKCIVFSTSPDNPRPPRQPLVATVKRGVLERRRRTVDAASTPHKRARTSAVKAKPSPARPVVPAAQPVVPVEDAESAADGPSRPKRQAAKNAPDYANLHNHVPTPTRTWLELIRNPGATGRVIGVDNFPRLPGNLLTRDWLDGKLARSKLPPTLFYGPAREPLVVTPQDGGMASLGGKVPGPALTVSDIARLVGPYVKVDVIDVATQQSSSWKLSEWAAYLLPSDTPKKVYNIISLEISGTELAKQVKPPRIVSEIDWVDNFWHFKAGKGAEVAASLQAEREVKDGAKKAPKTWPKVQLYCLMGMKDSWTDWHVDFAASSVYYHIHTGSKTFFFIRPTESNLAAYAEWSGSAEMQQSVWLPDMCDGVRKVTLRQGDTMLIPAGYIHAVYTPVDSIVFGGNFLHSYDIETQLRLRQIEIETKVPQRFRFPSFDKLCWYVAHRYTSDLRNLRAYRSSRAANTAPPIARVLEQLHHLARFLIAQADEIDNADVDDKRRKLVYDRVPTEMVTDYAGLGRELLWRVEREMPSLKQDVGGPKPVNGVKEDKKRKPRQSAPPSVPPDVKPTPPPREISPQRPTARVPMQTPPAYQHPHAGYVFASPQASATPHYPLTPYAQEHYAQDLASMAHHAPQLHANGHVHLGYPSVPEHHFSGHARAHQPPNGGMQVRYDMAPAGMGHGHGHELGYVVHGQVPSMSPNRRPS